MDPTSRLTFFSQTWLSSCIRFVWVCTFWLEYSYNHLHKNSWSFWTWYEKSKLRWAEMGVTSLASLASSWLRFTPGGISQQRARKHFDPDIFFCCKHRGLRQLPPLLISARYTVMCSSSYLEHAHFPQGDFLHLSVILALDEFLDRYQLAGLLVSTFHHHAVRALADQAQVFVLLHALAIDGRSP